MRRFTILLITTLLFASVCFADTNITGVEAQCTIAAVKCFEEEFGGKYDLKNYRIKLYLQEDDEENMRVAFLPNRVEGEPILNGGGTSFGDAISYLVRLRDYKVIKKIYAR